MSTKEEQRSALTQGMKEKIKKATGHICEYCGKQFPPHHLVIHHIDWVSQAEDDNRDKNTPSNLIALCLFHHNDCHNPILIQKAELKARIQQRPDNIRSEIRSILRNRDMMPPDDPTRIINQVTRDMERQQKQMERNIDGISRSLEKVGKW